MSKDPEPAGQLDAGIVSRHFHSLSAGMGEFSKLVIVGTGAIGGYYGARLARSGADVHFLARSDYAAISERGLKVTSPEEAWGLYPVQAYKTPQDIGPADLVIISLKATANGALGSLLPPLLHERTAILTLENGLGSDELLAQHFGKERVIGGLCFIAVNRTAPGELVCMHPGSISFAEYDRPAGPRLAELAGLFAAAGIEANTSDRLAELRWRKLVWNIPFNGLAIAAGGVTTDRILSDAGLEGEVRALMSEVIGAAAKLGYSIPLSFIDHQVEITRPIGPYKPSSLIDYLAGREVEVEAIWGEPLRRAQAAGAEMPRLARLYERLKVLTAKQAPLA